MYIYMHVKWMGRSILIVMVMVIFYHVGEITCVYVCIKCIFWSDFQQYTGCLFCSRSSIVLTDFHESVHMALKIS